MSRISLYTQKISWTPWYDGNWRKAQAQSPTSRPPQEHCRFFSNPLSTNEEQVAKKSTYPHKRAPPRLLHLCAHQRHTLSWTMWLGRTLLLLRNQPSHYQTTLITRGDFSPGLSTPSSRHWHAGWLHPSFAYTVSQGFSLSSVKCHHNSKWMNPKVHSGSAEGTSAELGAGKSQA